MTARFHNPVDTRFGWGSLRQLASLTENQQVALVIFPEARALGLLDRLQVLLGERLVHVVEEECHRRGIGLGFVSAVEYAQTPGTRPIDLGRSPVPYRLLPVLPGHPPQPADHRRSVRSGGVRSQGLA